MIIPKSQLIANINNEIVDNGDGLISPYDVRHNLIDLIDSVHLLTDDNNLNALNFSTPATRSVKAGERTLEKLNLDGYFSVDNSAFGYAALKSNYQGVKNTAIGSQSLNCNIYGESNTALGVNALGGNTTGNGNVGLGNNTLINNKVGNFNIAIGHSAGYYVSRDTSYKLFVASHPVESDYICANPLGSGLVPLLHGDLSSNNLKLGIAVPTLYAGSTLQVSGGIGPYLSSIDDVGSNNYRFRNIFLSNGIQMPSGKSLTYSYSNGSFVTNNSLLPSVDLTYSLGSTSNRWNSGHFFNLYVSGTAYIENYVRTTISECDYECKTLYLASSGLCNSSNGCGYLSDANLIYAGIIVKASGANYLRDYELTFRPSGNDVINLESYNIYAKSNWYSNISLHLASGNHLKTERVIGDNKLSLVTDPSGYGLFINKENVYLSRESIVPPLANPASGDISGLGQINFIKSSGTCGEYNFTLGALDSGVDISQKFINGLKLRNKDPLNNNKDKLRGFELKYYDDSDISYVGGLSDRFLIRSFNNTSDGVNNITLMKDDPNGGVFGINNFDSGGDNLFPKTILNIRSKDNAVARITAENASSGVHSAIQLLGGSNCLQDGYETIYYHDSGIVDLNLYQDSGKLNIFRYTPFLVGLFSSGNLNATLTIGASGFPQAAISLRDDSFKTVNPALVATSGYGKIYNTKVSKEYANQSHALMFMDASGYIHPLSQNKYDVLDGSILYSENYTDGNTYGGNTFGGINCPKTRLSFINSRLANTAYGTYSLYYLASGDRNTVIGFNAGSGINNGYNNVILGAYSAETLTSGDNNLILGTSAITHCSEYISKNIIIGNGLSPTHNSNYKFLLGYASNILISGAIGPSSLDKIFSLPNSGLLQVNDLTNTNYLKVRHNSIELYNQTSNLYPSERLNFNFATPSGSHTLVTFDYSVPSSGSGNYACSGLPYMQVNGNIKLLNNICFSDGTTLNSASQINIIDDLESSGIILNNRINNLFIEGIALTNVNPPSSSNNPTVGTIASKGINWSSSTNKTIVNRDTLLNINKDDYVIAIYINGEYRPIWVSSQALVCNSCNP